MPIHPASLETEKLLQDCKIQRTRGSGPGGQHRNKVETAIVVTHLPTGITGQASERRSQHQNQLLAIHRLRLNLAVGYRTPEADVAKVPSQLWVSRLRARKISVSSEHDDFPAILAEALDVLAINSFEAAAAANSLACSSSQLIKLLAKEPSALEWVNRQRVEQGKSRYR